MGGTFTVQHPTFNTFQHGKACVAAGMSITWAWQSSSGMFALNEMHPFRWRSLQTKIQAARRRLASVLVLPSCEVLQSWKARLKLDKNDFKKKGMDNIGQLQLNCTSVCVCFTSLRNFTHGSWIPRQVGRSTMVKWSTLANFEQQ
jgi:hypothetical protein